MNPLIAGSKYHMTEDGVFTQDQLLVAKIINDYNPTLQLVRNPEATRENGKMDCAVVCFPTNNQPPYVLFYLWLKDVDYRVIARIYQADMQHQNRPLEDQLEANEMAQRIFDAAKQEEEAAELRDLHKSIIKSKLHTYRHKGKVYR